MKKNEEKETNETKKCLYCKSDIDKDASICPNCKKKQKGKSTTKDNIIIIIVIIISICVLASLYSPSEKETKPKYDTEKVYNVGDTLICPNFEIVVKKAEIKKKGTKVDSYTVIDDPEWIGVTLSIKNISESTKTFYGSDVNLINSNGEVLDHDWMTYKIWGSEILNSPELIAGGTKTGYIQFSNNNTDNSNLILNIDCNTGLFEDDIIYKVNISK